MTDEIEKNAYFCTSSLKFYFMASNKSVLFWVLTLLSIVTIIPFLGLTDFVSKGEPREAVVALSMLKDGNWILPINNGGDIPYKPPFLHWIIALLSYPQGYVSEFTSRLPSALSLIAMVVIAFRFNARRSDAWVAFIASLLMLTAFEVHRAGITCRVDMLLTLCLVGSFWALYRWWENNLKGFPFLAVLAMSGAFLTKGPIGVLLPCFVMGVFMLLKGVKWWRAALMLGLVAIAASVLPLLWYVAAYQQAGDNFLRLVMEENVGRFLGRMSYDSHVHNVFYNFVTLIAGWLPYTLLVVFSLFVLSWKKVLRLRSFSGKQAWEGLKKMDPFTLFNWLCFLLTLLFYCIPKSKRSVYLLPCYPFMAMLLSQYFLWLVKKHVRVVKTYGAVMAVLGMLVIVLFAAVKCGLVPDTIFHGKHAAQNVLVLRALEDAPVNARAVLLMLLPVVVGAYSLRFLPREIKTEQARNSLLCTILLNIVAIFMLLDGYLQPIVMNVNSNRPIATLIEKRYPGVPVYQYIDTDMLHFFGADFYTGDRLRQFELDKPYTGVLMVGRKDMQTFLEKHKSFDYTVDYHTTKPMAEVKDTIYFLRFNVMSAVGKSKQTSADTPTNNSSSSKE